MSHETACAICLHDCIPMADYDQPVCASCDLDMELTLLRASIPDAVPGLSPRHMPIRPGTPDSFRGPAPKPVIDELVAALYGRESV